MKKSILFFMLLCCGADVFAELSSEVSRQIVTFVEPQRNGSFSLEQVIVNRRSVRQFTAAPLQMTEIGQLCFAGQGITDKQTGYRAAPSAGGIYPMQLHVVLPKGVYLYEPATHSLSKTIDSDVRPMLYVSSFKQSFVQNCPCIIVISAAVGKLEAKYRGRGSKFAALEAGHIAENIQLQAVSLGLGSVPVGAFDPKSTAKICKLEKGVEPLYLMCVGNPVEPPSLVGAVASVAAKAAGVKNSSDDIRSKRVAVIVPQKYFNDVQYYGVEDVLLIAGIVPDIASSVTGEIRGIEKNIISSTILLRDLNADDYDAFVFIGGPGVRESLDSRVLIELIREANKKGKILASIENTPQLFANAGIVRDKKVTSAPAQRNKLRNAGAQWRNTGVEIDSNLITANDHTVARRFGVAILNLLRLQE